MKKVLFTFLAAMCCMSVFADNFEFDGIMYNVTGDNTVEVVSKEQRYSGTITIPSTVTHNSTTYNVTSIGIMAFYACSGLTSVNISSGVETIGDCAFYDCPSLTSVDIPNTVTSIGYAAFYECSQLRSIEIPNSVKSIERHTFYGCTSMSSAIIPNSVASIGDWAFCNCYSLTSINIPNSLTSIGEAVFSGCIGLTSVIIPNSVKCIGDLAFRSCSGLTSIDIPTSVNIIGIEAFNGCKGLTSVIIPNSVTSLGGWAFASCSGLTSIDIPNSVTHIGDCAFRNCTSLTSIELPNSVDSISDFTFLNCTSLTSITIPNSVKSIGAASFYGCSALASIDFPNSVTSIGGSAFEGCLGLTSVNIPTSVTSIGYAAFADCSALTSVIIPNSVTSVGDWAFDGCSGLTSIDISDALTSIGEGLFSNCVGLTSIIIPNSVASIGPAAFYECKGLKEIYVLATTPPSLESDAFDKVPTNIPVYVPDVETYNGWGGFVNLILLTNDKAIANLLAFIEEEKIANAPMDEYAGLIYAATTPKDILDIFNNIKKEINNFDKFTLGEWKYLLKDGAIVGDELTFTDQEAYQSDFDFTVNKLTYSRTFTDTNWQALYVPFAMSYDDWQNNFEVAAINNFHEYTDSEGNMLKTELEVRLVKNHILKPNHPYLIRAKVADEANPQTISPSGNNIKICKSDENSIVCSSIESKYTFTGTYKDIAGMKANDCYLLSEGKLYKVTDDDVTLSAQRWYLSVESLDSQFGDDSTIDAKAMQFDIKLLDDDPTSIDEITTTRTPLKNNDDAIYNLNGMRVNNSYRGIVIRHGKKYLVK